SLAGIASLAKTGAATFLKSGLAAINASVEDAIAKFSSTRPERIAPQLAAGLNTTIALLDQLEKSSLPADAKYDIRHEVESKRAQFNNALAEAVGLSVAALAASAEEPDPQFAFFRGEPESSRTIIPGQTVGVRVEVVSQSPAPVRLDRVTV